MVAIGDSSSAGPRQRRDATVADRAAIVALDRARCPGNQTLDPSDPTWWRRDGSLRASASGAGVLQLNRSPHPHLASPADAEVGSGSAAPGTLRLWNIPPPVRTYAGRDLQLAAIREQLAAGEAVALVPAAALHVVLVVLIAVLIMTTCCPSGSPLST